MTLKKFLIFPVLFLLINCSYEPIFSKKNIISVAINNIVMVGDKKINRSIISKLNLKKNNRKDSYELNLNSTKKIETLAKDSFGNDSIYRTSITVNLILKKQEDVFKEKSFTTRFSYNNTTNKFNLSEYQKNIEIDLINKIIQEMNIYLSS